MGLEAWARSLLRSRETTVQDLYLRLKITYPTVDPKDVTELVWRFVEEGIIRVEDVPLSGVSLSQYLRMWDENLWFYMSIGTALIASLAAYTLPMNSPLVALRWLLGTAFVLFVPGFAVMEALFPARGDLGTFVRFALSIGVSLVLVMLVGLVLSYTPWGNTMTPILISLSTLTVGLASVAVGRKYALSVRQSHL